MYAGILDIDGNVPQRLCCINQKECPLPSGYSRDLVNRLQSARDVGGVVHGNHPRIDAHRAANVVRIDKPLPVAANTRDLNVLIGFQVAKRAQDRIVFCDRGHYVIARAQSST